MMALRAVSSTMVCDANSVVEGGRGEAIEPSNSSDDRRSTSEVAPQKEVVSFGKRHELTNNYRVIEANDSGWVTFVCDSVCLEKSYTTYLGSRLAVDDLPGSRLAVDDLPVTW
ncbi:hypothetical protein YC2023_117813 [Brassica napus]